MIVHCVHLNLKDNADPGALAAIMDGLEALCGRLEGCETYQHGPNRDFEAKSPDYPYGFVVQFRDAAALEQYACHPEHRALGARLVGLCKGGADGVIVFDLEVS